MLLEKGADINIPARPNAKPTLLLTVLLQSAPGLAKTPETLVRLLLEKGADVQGRDAMGQTPLHLAARQGSPELLGLLLARGAEVDARLPSKAARFWNGRCSPRANGGDNDLYSTVRRENRFRAEAPQRQRIIKALLGAGADVRAAGSTLPETTAS